MTECEGLIVGCMTSQYPKTSMYTRYWQLWGWFMWKGRVIDPLGCRVLRWNLEPGQEGHSWCQVTQSTSVLASMR